MKLVTQLDDLSHFSGTSALIIFPTSREQRNMVQLCTRIGDACDHVDDTYKTN